MKKIIFIVGPTAVGKSEIAVALAKKINGEIISCDSMQVYKEVSIANSRPSPAQLRAIPHHLVGVVSVKKEFDVAAFNRWALAAIQMIHHRKKIPIVVGGSGLYMQVLLDGIFEGGEKDLPLRKKLEQQASEQGPGFFHDQLKAVDPAAASKIHPRDRKRLIRALEIFYLKKNPISQLQKKRHGLWGLSWRPGQGRYDIILLGLNRERQELYQRIEERVEQMFAAELIEEVKKLLALKLSQTAQAMIGLKEVGGFLRGEYDLERAKYLMKRNTRRFAKRQLTWFRREKRLRWIHLNEEDKLEKITQRIQGLVTRDPERFFEPRITSHCLPSPES